MPESDRPQKATRVGESDEGNVDLPSRDLIGRWFVAFGGVVGVESPFGVDASLTVVFAGVLAARHHQATVRFYRDDRGRANGCGGRAQRGKQQPTTRMRGKGLAAGRSPDQRAIG